MTIQGIRTQPNGSRRLCHIDNLKLFLTILVIFHHTGQPYGPTGGFWQYEPSVAASADWLGSFFAVNASFFMGLFFMLSGYVLPNSLRGKTLSNFTFGRIRRLLPPILLLFLVISPLQMYYHYQCFSGNPPLNLVDYYIRIYLGIGGMPVGFISSIGFPELNFSHGWYIEQLLILSILYGVLATGVKKAMASPPSLQNPLPPLRISMPFMLLTAALLSVLNLVVRGHYPIDTWIGLLGFIQAEPAHMPEYLLFFIIGILASGRGSGRAGQFESMDHSCWKTALGLGLTMAAGVYLRLFLPTAYGDLLFRGWWFYEAFMAVFLSFGLIGFSVHHLSNLPKALNDLLNALAPLAFTAYIIHYPVVLSLQHLTDGMDFIGVNLKFVLVAVVSTVMTFVLSKVWQSLMNGILPISK